LLNGNRSHRGFIYLAWHNGCRTVLVGGSCAANMIGKARKEALRRNFLAKVEQKKGLFPEGGIFFRGGKKEGFRQAHRRRSEKKTLTGGGL